MTAGLWHCALLAFFFLPAFPRAFDLDAWGELTVFVDEDRFATAGELSVRTAIGSWLSLYGRLYQDEKNVLTVSGSMTWAINPLRFSLAADFRDDFHRMFVDATYWRSPWNGRVKLVTSAYDMPSLELSWAYEQEYRLWGEGTYELRGQWQDLKLGGEWPVLPNWKCRTIIDFDAGLTTLTLKQQWKGYAFGGRIWLDFENLRFIEGSWSQEIRQNGMLHTLEATILWQELLLDVRLTQETELNGVGIQACASLLSLWRLDRCLVVFWGQGWRFQIDTLMQILKLHAVHRWSTNLQTGYNLAWAENMEGEAWVSFALASSELVMGALLEARSLRFYVKIRWTW